MVERGPGDGPKPHHTWHYPCGFGPSGGEAHPAHPCILQILIQTKTYPCAWTISWPSANAVSISTASASGAKAAGRR